MISERLNAIPTRQPVRGSHHRNFGQAGQFFQDFSNSAVGATNFSDGSQLHSTDYSMAQVTFSPYNELQLTANGASGTYSAYEPPDLDSTTPVYAFSAKWNMPVG